MARFRLKFLLQEFDLPRGEILIGRSPDCHVTIEDPLISRQHAKLVVREDGATVCDLKSRNGSRLNGERIRGEESLKDGDRIRLGAQELLFYRVLDDARHVRPTGFMTVCNACRTPFPQGVSSCPHCGAPASEVETRLRCERCGHGALPTDTCCSRCGAVIIHEEDTISGISVEPRSAWAFQLLAEVIDKALALGRLPEAERVMARAARELDERLAANGASEIKHVINMCDFAMRIAEAGGADIWVGWTLSVFRRLVRVPPPAMADRIAAFIRAGAGNVLGELDVLILEVRQKGGTLTTEEVESLARLQAARPGLE